MFNTTNNITRGNNYVPYEKSVTIKEYKASTDESLKMLQEMQDKARESIISMVHLQDNSFHGAVMFFNTNPMFDHVILHIRFKLNEQEFRIEHKLERREYNKMMQDAHTVAFNIEAYVKQCITKMLADAVAEHLYNNCGGFHGLIQLMNKR